MTHHDFYSPYTPTYSSEYLLRGFGLNFKAIQRREGKLKGAIKQIQVYASLFFITLLKISVMQEQFERTIGILGGTSSCDIRSRGKSNSSDRSSSSYSKSKLIICFRCRKSKSYSSRVCCCFVVAVLIAGEASTECETKFNMQ